MTVDNVDYSVKTDESLSSPATDAEDGDGGGNMSVWTESRANQINKLLTGPPYSDNSDFGLPKAISPGSYPQTLSQAEHGLSGLSLEAASGTGGGTMDIWSQTRAQKLDSLVQAGVSYTNQSAYSIPKGVTGYGMALSTIEKPLSTPTAGVELGPNVSGSINFDGSLLVVRDPDDPGNLPTLPVPDADITIKPLPVGGLDNDTLSNSDGTYLVPVPRKTDTTEYEIIVDHEYYGKITFTETTQQGQMNVTRDLYLPFPAGMRTTRGIEMGGPLRG